MAFTFGCTNAWCAIASECVSLEQQEAWTRPLEPISTTTPSTIGRGPGSAEVAPICLSEGRVARRLFTCAGCDAAGSLALAAGRGLVYVVKYHLCDGNKKAAKALLVKITASRSACIKEGHCLDSWSAGRSSSCYYVDWMRRNPRDGSNLQRTPSRIRADLHALLGKWRRRASPALSRCNGFLSETAEWR